MLVGIDLFVRRCIEGVQLTRAAGPVTYPPQLTRRQPPKRLGVGACSGFGRSRSERVFRNEFPYLGRAGPAARASFRLVGGDRIVRTLLVPGAQAQQPAPAPGAPAAAPKAAAQGRPEGRPEGAAPAAAAAQPPRRPALPQPAPSRRTAGSADLCALDQVLPEGPGRQRQAGLLHRQGRTHRVRPARHRGRHHRAGRRAEEDPARDAAARHAARSRHPHHRRHQSAGAEPLCDLLRQWLHVRLRSRPRKCSPA